MMLTLFTLVMAFYLKDMTLQELA